MGDVKKHMSAQISKNLGKFESCVVKKGAPEAKSAAKDLMNYLIPGRRMWSIGGALSSAAGAVAAKSAASAVGGAACNAFKGKGIELCKSAAGSAIGAAKSKVMGKLGHSKNKDKAAGVVSTCLNEVAADVCNDAATAMCGRRRRH